MLGVDSIVSEGICQKLSQFSEHHILTITKAPAQFVNHTAIKGDFQETPLDSMILDDNNGYPISRKMQLILTRNCNKDLDFGNGQLVIIITTEGNSIVV